mmetsp:Transcript_15948/g.40357  ORF Transcript_15948/g.40357 Transcript_15948/m.40357 type:complete len:220 (-) Transcript_15948:249-908(-)
MWDMEVQKRTGQNALEEEQEEELKDLKLVISFENFARMLRKAELPLENRSDGEHPFSAETVIDTLKSLHGGKPKLAFRVTKGPSNACIGFHCDGEYASRTVQIPLNSEEEYEGGKLVFFQNDGIVVASRRPGSFSIHEAKVLHGVTKLSRGTRKSLFVVDEANGLGFDDVVTVQDEDVTAFFDHPAEDPAEEQPERDEGKESGCLKALVSKLAQLFKGR